MILFLFSENDVCVKYKIANKNPFSPQVWVFIIFKNILKHNIESQNECLEGV
jgi:hypothetical protein